jgi:hypothetical protein
MPLLRHQGKHDDRVDALGLIGNREMRSPSAINLSFPRIVSKIVAIVSTRQSQLE